MLCGRTIPSPGSGLPGNQDRKIRIRKLFRRLNGRLHRFADHDDVVERGPRREAARVQCDPDIPIHLLDAGGLVNGRNAAAILFIDGNGDRADEYILIPAEGHVFS